MLQLDELRATNSAIPANWTEVYMDSMVTELWCKEPLRSLVANKSSSFYIFFARSDRFDVESTAFLTKRGGDGSGEK
ncbi:hypothetical protein HDV05_001222, partial [Chytridiales sp. JEL 0842]